jgi:hypothetical protein
LAAQSRYGCLDSSIPQQFPLGFQRGNRLFKLLPLTQSCTIPSWHTAFDDWFATQIF